MAKNKISELMTYDGEKKVLTKSKTIKKHPTKKFGDKEKTRQTILKDSAEDIKKEPGALSVNGNFKGSKLKKHKNKKSNAKKDNSDEALVVIAKKRTVEKQIVAKNTNEKSLAKIERKKAKKLAKKIKKNNKIEESKLDNSKGPAEPLSARGKIVESSQPNQKVIQKKKGVNQKGKESKQVDPIKEASTVFVGNLPVNTKRVQLIRLFNDYGPVNAIRFRTASGKVLFKHKHRKEAGTLNAWVVLKDAETATRALGLNGTVFKSNHLRITPADLNSSSMDIKRTIFVGNLKYSATEEKLQEIFSSCGAIDYVRCLHDDKGCKGVAYVCFKAPEAVGLALELNETMLDERPIHVERYSVKKLGAKKAREATNDSKVSSQGGEKLSNKKQKDTKDVSNTKKEEKKKKTNYRGVKVDGTKKKQKKVTTQMQKLAKKIAPK